MIKLSWTTKLLETYDMCSELIGDTEKAQDKMLLPISHLTQRAQVEVAINEDGSFQTASELDVSECVTVIPVTEDSASRSSGISPHPLHDKLIYVAKTYDEYVDASKKEYHEKYMKNLKQWVESPYSHSTIQVIYEYLLNGTLIDDLISTGILTTENGKIDKKKKFQKQIDATSILIRFRVNSFDKKREAPWKDKSLFQCFVDYYKSLHTDEDICYVTGKRMYCTSKHPSKIRYGSDKAKLISSNDNSGFTYRGRIAGSDDINSMGYETSQKIHSALRWLIKKQGYQNYGLTVLIWNVENKPVFGNQLFDFNPKREASTNETYAALMNKMIRGFRKEIEPKDGIIIMMMEAATEGRLSITAYQELSSSRYYDNIEQWFQDCVWYRGYTPTPDDIIKAAFGTLRNDHLDLDEKVLKMQLKRLLPCILMGKNLPKDMIAGVYQQVLTMSQVDNKMWEYCIEILCILARRERMEENRKFNKGGVWSMDLDENIALGNETPAFIYGELLAIYHEIEAYSLRISDEKRDTNVMRLFVEFKKFPWRTLNRIDTLANPYIRKLGSRANTLLKLREEVCEKMHNIPGIQNMRNLDLDVVIGFDCMRKKYESIVKEFKVSKENQKNNTKEEI